MSLAYDAVDTVIGAGSSGQEVNKSPLPDLLTESMASPTGFWNFGITNEVSPQPLSLNPTHMNTVILYYYCMLQVYLLVSYMCIGRSSDEWTRGIVVKSV